MYFALHFFHDSSHHCLYFPATTVDQGDLFAGSRWCNSKVPSLCSACTGETVLSPMHITFHWSRMSSDHFLAQALSPTTTTGSSSQSDCVCLPKLILCRRWVLQPQCSLPPWTVYACTKHRSPAPHLTSPANSLPPMKTTAFLYPFFPIFQPGELPMRGISFFTHNKLISLWVSDEGHCPKAFWKSEQIILTRSLLCTYWSLQWTLMDFWCVISFHRNWNNFLLLYPIYSFTQ